MSGVQEYGVFAKNLKKGNPKISQLEVEKRYKTYLELKAAALKRTEARAAVSSRSKRPPARPKPSARAAPASSAKSNSRALVPVPHACLLRPVKGMPIVATHQNRRFPVFTYSSTSNTTITVPDGCRLFLSLQSSGSGLINWFYLPIANPIFDYDFEAGAIWSAANLLTGSTGLGFQTAGNSYFTEVGQKSYGYSVVNGIDIEDNLQGVSADVSPALHRLRGKITMATASMDMTIATTYVGNAIVHDVATDSDDCRKECHDMDATSLDNDGSVGFVLRRSLGTALNHTFNQSLNVHSPSLVGPSQQRHFVKNIKLCRPQWWVAGTPFPYDNGSDATFRLGCQPGRNPFFDALQTGSWTSVQAVGGPVTVMVRASRTNHLEYSSDIDSGSGYNAFWVTPMTHYTTSNDNVARAFDAPYAKVGVGNSTALAIRDLERQSGLPPGSQRAIMANQTVLHPPHPSTVARDMGGESGHWYDGVRDTIETVRDVAVTAYEVGKVIADIASMF